ncbi:hypothetical protein EON65_24205 [archaeon]|nr:MAG: hypothetical protein EON65_24205 [archaeon]
MAQDILKAGWLDKEFASRSWFKYRPRYVVLTTLNIKYYYQEADALDSSASDNARQEIPLLTVNDGSILDHGTREAEIIHIETPSRTWRFKAANALEAEQWRQAIVVARSKLGVSRVHFGVLPNHNAQNTKPKLESVQEEGEGEEEKESKLQELYVTYQQNDELLNALENITCNSVDKAKYTANLFFESVSVLPLKERANRAKEMARAMVSWVNFDDNERVGSGYDSCLKV